MSRTILVEGTKTFRITIPDNAKVTFGPWSPPSGKESNYDRSGKSMEGTLRVYENAKTGASVLGVFSGVKSFREDTLGYEEKIATAEVRSMWKSDKTGYKSETEGNFGAEWIDPDAPEQLETGNVSE